MLLLRPDHIGDVLLTSPAVALLRESLPRAHLSYIVGPWSAEVAWGGPPVDSLRTLTFPGFTRRSNANLLAPYALLMREAAGLRRERYDLAVVFRPDHWWGALLTQIARIPVRVGGGTPETTPLLTHVRGAVPGEHATQTALGLARLALDTFGVPAVDVSTLPSFRVSQADRTTAREFWARHGFGDQRVVGIAPSAGATLKSWPIGRWADLADELVATSATVLFIGGPDDGALVAAIQACMSQAPAATAWGQSLGVSAALLERCWLLVGLDGGQAHLAGAVGTPTVRLYGPAPSQAFGPWPAQEQQRVLVAGRLGCVPCGYLEAPPCGATALPACMLALGVEDVMKAVRAQFERH